MTGLSQEIMQQPVREKGQVKIDLKQEQHVGGGDSQRTKEKTT